MRRHSAFIPLSREHHDGLLLAARLQQGHKALLKLWSHDLNWQAEYIEKFFNDNLERHFQVEENILFPVAHSTISDRAVLVQHLLDEHKYMTSMIEYFRHPNQIDLAKTLKSFGKTLEDHIHSEERELFPICEQNIPAEKLAELGKSIKHYLKGV
jgi:hemerythrin-like domain-containing protein